MNNNNKKGLSITWQIAYVARELRHKHKITITCLKSETTSILEQLSSFCNSKPIMTNSTVKPNSNNEVFLEIVNAY